MAEKLEIKEYLVGITIIEGRNIYSKKSNGTSDPFLKIKVADQVQQTQKKYEQNSALWAQSLTFSKVLMNDYELETFEMIIELYDHNQFFLNQLIGQYSIGLSTLHRALNHEFYKTWVGCFHPDNPDQVQGYLQISCFIVGPGEKPPTHSSEDDDIQDEEQDDEEDEEEWIKKIESLKRAQGITMINQPALISKYYQMAIVISKAENIAICEQRSWNPFISARVNGCVLPTKCQANSNPVFNQKLMFPLTYPILNDKITMRIWSDNKGLTSNSYIANIPEHPNQSDYFNISKILAQDGRMSSRWMNLYGPEPSQRGPRTKGRIEGSCWLGRVLLAFNIMPFDQPVLQLQSANMLKEPVQEQFSLWVDLYEIIDFKLDKLENEKIFVTVSQGQFKTPEAIAPKFIQKTNSYSFEKRKKVDTILSEFPMDFNQIPDIFIDIYCNQGDEPVRRVGYVRIKAIDVSRRTPNPQWMKIRSPYNDINQNKLGQIMMNVQFLRRGNDHNRVLLDKGAKQIFKFYYQIINGFELASSINEDDLDTKVIIDIGDKKDIIQTETSQGHYPIWNKTDSLDVSMQKELGFQADMKVSVFNMKKNNGGKEQESQYLGGFCVTIKSLEIKCEKPQFFNVINENGQFIGQILANFYVKFLPKMVKSNANKNQEHPEHIENQKFFKRFQDYANIQYFKLEISLLAIRNLVSHAIDPVVTIWLSNDKQNNKKIKITDDDSYYYQFREYQQTQNPTFGRTVVFEKIALSLNEPLLWPFLIIQVQEDMEKKVNMFSKKGCESVWTTLSLLHYAKDILDKDVFRYAKAQFSRNQKYVSYIQEQINPVTFMKLLEVSDDDSQGSGSNESQSQNENASSDSNENVNHNDINAEIHESKFRKSVMPNGMIMNQIVNQEYADNNVKKHRVVKKDIFNIFNNGRSTKDNLNLRDTMDMFFEFGARKTMAGANFNAGTDLYFGNDENDDDDSMAINMMDGNELIQNNDLNSGIQIGFGLQQFDQQYGDKDSLIQLNSIDVIDVGKNHKKRENREREQRIQEIKNEMKVFLEKILNLEPDQVFEKRVYQMHVYELQEEEGELKSEIMTEQRFWGANAALDEEDQEFDYGRDTLKKENYDEIIAKKALPYEIIPLFLKTEWQKYANIQPNIVEVKGIMRSGILSSAILKGKIRLLQIQNENHYDIGQINLNDRLDRQDNQGLVKYQQNLKLVDKISKDLVFKIHEEKFMRALTDQYNDWYKVRIYLLSGQNISAMNNLIDYKSYLAGMYAMCTSNPYPWIKIGEGNSNNNVDKKHQKEIRAREIAAEGDLNPQFLKMYELDARLPEDLNLEISIYDKTYDKLTDVLIGTTKIDLENRRLSNKLILCRKAAEIELEELKNKKNLKDDKMFKKELNKIIQRNRQQRESLIRQHQAKMVSIDQLMVPIEFREIYHPKKLQAQGILEMFTEVLTLEESRKIPISKIRQVAKKVYEIRLIIWETRDIPLVDGGKADIFVKCTFDPTGWSADEVKKTTDTHMNSTDGTGQFNWRMKFDINVPCEFPRLKFEVLDAGVASDESIGTASINLKRTINKLKKEERVSVPKSFLNLTLPQFQEESRGLLMFSMDILQKEDANQDPVGEAQDEPNKDPKLKAPTAGRGLGDAMAAIGLSVPALNWNPFGNYIYVIAFFGVMGTVLTFAVLLKK